MTRSSRHKSSKHRDVVRKYSDSEKDLSLKDRKSKEESGGGGGEVKVSKEWGSCEKRKLDLKEGKESRIRDYVEDLVTLKRQKERLMMEGVIGGMVVVGNMIIEGAARA